jgi:hypothetical protein
MLTVEEGKKAVRYARKIIEGHTKKTTVHHPEFQSVFQEKRGVFVTLHTHPDHELRGCIGIPHPVMTLKEAIKEAAVSSTHDPRFFPLNEQELDGIIVEVTVLTKPEHIDVDDPENYLSHITIGKDGLIIEYLGRSGLLFLYRYMLECLL